MHRQELLRAGSRRAYHPGVGWNLGAAKSCMFQSLGSEDLYPVVRTRFSVVFGNALFDSTDGGCLAYYLPAARRGEGYHPTRASERGRAKGRADDIQASFKTDNRVSTSSSFEFRSVAIACHLSFGHFSSCLEPHHLFAMRFKILLWMLISGPPRWQARVKILSHGRVLYH